MSLNATEIQVVVAAMSATVVPARVRKVIDCNMDGEVALVLRTPGKNHYLIINCRPGTCHVGIEEKKPIAASVPSSFVMLCRKHLEGGVVTDVVQHNDDRVVSIEVETRTEKTALMCELIDRHANVFALDSHRRVLASLWPTKSAARTLAPNTLWHPPPRPFAMDDTRACRFLGDSDVPLAVARYYRTAIQQDLDSRLRQQLDRHLRKERQRLQRRKQNIENDRAQAETAAALQQQAFVIQANLSHLTRGMTIFSGKDFEGNPIDVALNPRLNGIENMQAMFRKAGRFKQAHEVIASRYRQAVEALTAIEKTQAKLASADDTQLAALAANWLADAEKQGKHRARRQPQATRLPYRQVRLGGGYLARVGRSARDNDALVRHYASPPDLWLHARGIPGSHVVVPLDKTADVSQEVLVDAAHLAAHFSNGRHQSVVEVSYTRCRYLQKPKGAPPGQVVLTREKTIALRVDSRRLQRLLSDKDASG